MNRRSQSVIALSLAAVAILGCGSDSDSDINDGAEELDTNAADTTEVSPSDPVLGAAPECLHDPTTVLIRIDDPDQRTGIIQVANDVIESKPLVEDELLDKVGLTSDSPFAAEFLDVVNASMLVYPIVDDGANDGDSPAVALATALNTALGSSQAAPLLMIGFAGHWGFAPGKPSRPMTEAVVSYDEHDAGRNPIVVIDTGFVDLALASDDPTKPSVTAAGAADHETTYASVPDGYRGHGTFIASILRQESDAPVVQYRLPATTATLARSSSESLTAQDGVVAHGGTEELLLSDELQFLLTVVRAEATTSPKDSAEPFVLNVSSGAYPCEPDLDSLAFGAIGTRAALDHWKGGHDCRFVVASAGNGGTDGVFVPADYGDVQGVSATELSGGTPVRATFSNNGDVRAPGVDLIGHRGPDEIVAWSGTSFAAPVVAAQLAAGSCDPSAGPTEVDAVRVQVAE